MYKKRAADWLPFLVKVVQQEPKRYYLVITTRLVIVLPSVSIRTT